MKGRKKLTLTIWYVLMATVTAQPKEMFLSEEVQNICDSFFAWRIKSLPQFATFVGIPDYNEYLDDLSEDAFLKRYKDSQEFLEQVLKLQPTLVQEADILNVAVLLDEIQTFIDGFKFNGFYLPVNNMEGPHADIENLLGWMPKKSYSDYEVILKRMKVMPHQFDQMINLMKKGVTAGITYHEYSMNGVEENLDRFIVENSQDSPLYSYFADNYPDKLSKQQIEVLQANAKQIIGEKVTPAYEKLRKYISEEYITREKISASSLPNGSEYYNQLIRYHTSTNMTAEEIQNVGYTDVEAIEAKMFQIVQEMGYENMSVNDFSDMIRKDETNFYNNTEDIMARFRKLNYEVIPSHLTEIFKHVPEIKLEIMADPTLNGPGAFYYAGSYDGSRSGVFYVNTYRPEGQPKYSMMTLSLHEGNPGHHFQVSYSLEDVSMPSFRRVSDDRNYGLAPSTYPKYTGYVEGWGLYSEGLGFDMNLYDDPLDRYGHYSEEMFRACRLVVDTGMHAFNWSREEAIEYMLTHTATPRLEVEREIDRYITWPGQALAYKIGQLKIRQLREKAETIMGDAFDIKEFHEIVLKAVGPLSLVEESVTKWITDYEANS